MKLHARDRTQAVVIALAHGLLEAIGRGATADGMLGHAGRNGLVVL